MIWFSADAHFYHSNILKFQNRPFRDIAHMHEMMIGWHNELVAPDDDVYLLGDFAFGGPQQVNRVIDRLNGSLHLVPGSHDKRYNEWNLDVLPPIYELNGCMGNTGWNKIMPIVLCHYAMRVWPKSHHGSWHLFGHSHGKLPASKNSFDVGVDSWDYRPVSLDMVCKKMKEDAARIDATPPKYLPS